MSPENLSRRTLLAGAPALAIAAAAAVPLIATAAPAPNAVSFPDLVARLVSVRDHKTALYAIEDAWSDGIDKLFYEMTGTSADQMRAAERGGTRSKELNALHRKIARDNPPDYPVDERGESIELQETFDELGRVAAAILDQTPLSIVDIAWQAEALVTWDTELMVTGDRYPQMTQRLIENIRTLSGPLSVPGVVSAPAKQKHVDDPIYAAIEQRRRAWAELCANCSALDEAEQAGDKKAKRKLKALHNACGAADINLIEVVPTTVAGVAALLAHLAEQSPEGRIEEAEIAALHKNLAAVLSTAA